MSGRMHSSKARTDSTPTRAAMWSYRSAATLAFVGAATFLHPAWAAPPEPSSKALFQRLDSDGNGRLSASEFPADRRRLIERLLRVADQDQDGELTPAEFQRGIQPDGPTRSLVPSRPQVPEPEQLRSLLTRFNRNQDDKVEVDEVPERFRPQFRQLVARLDRNGDGAIGLMEFDAAFRKDTLPMRAATDAPVAANLFRRVDKDGNGEVTLDEVPKNRREQFERLLDLADQDADGGLTRQEFLRGWSLLQQRRQSDRSLRPPSNRLWMVLDRDQDGTLSADEIANAQQQLATLDKNGDGKLSAGEVAENR